MSRRGMGGQGRGGGDRGGGSKRGRGRGSQSITAMKVSDPPFIKRIKEARGYKDPDSIDDKSAALSHVDDDVDNRPVAAEEQPQIVVLKDGDLTAEDVLHMEKEKDEAEEKRKIEQGIIEFRKPNSKRPSKDPFEDGESKKAKDESEEESSTNQEIQSRLLSFAEPADEDDD